MKKIISMILIFILGFTFIVGRPKLNPAAAAHESMEKELVFPADKIVKIFDIVKPIAVPHADTNLQNVVYYLPKRDEEIEYWLK